MKHYLILILFTLKIYSQDIREINPFYLAEISSFKIFYTCTDELNSEKQKALFKEISSLPKVNSVNSKFYKENGNSIFELYGEKNIRLKMVKSANTIDCTIYLYSNGKVAQEIPYKNGKVNGVYKVFSSDGSIEFETNFKDDKRNGIRRFNTSDNQTIEANFINGQVVGKVKVINQDYLIKYMLYPNNLKNGTIEYYDTESNLLFEVPFIDKNIVQGEVIDYSYHSKIKHLVRNHKMGKLDDKTEFFDEKGNSKCVLNFKDGKPIGAHKEFYLNGGVYRESFYDENGIKTGTWKTYDESGKLKNEISYINGKTNGIENTYINGFLISTCETKDDKMKDGDSKRWNPETKKLESKTKWKDGKEIGVIYYFKNGNIFKRLEFNLNHQVIKAEYFNKEGGLFYEEKYNSDKSSEGTHKYYYKDRNDDYFIANEDEFDKDGFRVREKNYMGGENFNETKYKKNGCNIKTIYKDKIITTEYYYYTRKVSLEEFSKYDK